MKIYHYTTIDSLAMIMSSRSIKFNRLDKVDDMEERTEPSNIRLWQYIFVSCWTENAEESIPLWRMYSGNAHGVRIGMNVDMFEDNVIGGSNVPAEIPHEGFLVGKIPAQDLFRSDYFVVPISLRQNPDGGDTLFYCHVNYVDDVNAMINLILNYDQYKDQYPGSADLDGNGMVDVDDVNALINIILAQ